MGDRYIEELLARSIFEDGIEDRDGVVRQVKMHDLLHDLARSVAGEESTIAEAASGYAIRQGSRYLSFVYDRPISKSQPLPFLSKANNKLRSFYFIAQGDMKNLGDNNMARVLCLNEGGSWEEQKDPKKEEASKPAELVKSKLRPSDDDPSVMSASCFAKYPVYGGENFFPLF
ncbi:hypothetical protein J5N97_014595 [Dioscorea zingiberensis]|uniref:Disease resistance protein winged helix domain-containing protein n=1 Tax=Dioscorea zingiberensis TaxID=325984 RepID=A0A9D5CST3_9LILI|nr:hypothetical protein J5N97_014595 [Dioscorea zingiberensis]